MRSKSELRSLMNNPETFLGVGGKLEDPTKMPSACEYAKH
jgi:hypothetical protein